MKLVKEHNEVEKDGFVNTYRHVLEFDNGVEVILPIVDEDIYQIRQDIHIGDFTDPPVYSEPYAENIVTLYPYDENTVPPYLKAEFDQSDFVLSDDVKRILDEYRKK